MNKSHDFTKQKNDSFNPCFGFMKKIDETSSTSLISNASSNTFLKETENNSEVDDEIRKEIETRFNQSITNAVYKFPRRNKLKFRLPKIQVSSLTETEKKPITFAKERIKRRDKSLKIKPRHNPQLNHSQNKITLSKSIERKSGFSQTPKSNKKFTIRKMRLPDLKKELDKYNPSITPGPLTNIPFSTTHRKEKIFNLG